MNITKLTVGLLETCCYLLWEDNRPDCLVIDPGAEPEKIREVAGDRKIAGILLTHGHFDHIGAVDKLQEPGTCILIHPADASMLMDGKLNASRLLLGRDVTVPAVAELISDGQSFTLAGLSFEVIHTPGHTGGGVCYRFGEHLFTGDTLFEHGWGRTDLPGGSQVELMQSLRKILSMARTMIIHPGHGG